MGFRIVNAGNPHVACAMTRAVEAAPRAQRGIALFHGNGMEGPLNIARLGIAGLNVSRFVQIVTGADKDVVADDHGGHRREVLLIEIRDFLVPALLARGGIEAYQVIVRSFEIEPVAPHADAAASDMRAASGLP